MYSAEMSHVTSVRETSEASVSLTVSEISITESVDHIDLEKLKEEIKNIADKQKRKDAYQKYMHLLHTASSSNTKALSKAERREKQEAQRECKQSKDREKPLIPKPSSAKASPPTREGKPQTSGQMGNKSTSAASPGKISLNVNGAIYQCGLWMKAYKIIGSNARVRATLLALKHWLRELTASSTDEKIFSHENFAATNKLLSSQLSYLEDCRKKSTGMGNAIRLLKELSFRISQERIGESTAYARLAEFTDLFRSEKIDFAVEKISDYGARRIHENDLIATFGHSESISGAIRRAAQTKCFTVIIIDTPPLFEGRILLRELQDIPNIKIRYSLMSSITSSLNDASKVFIGTSAVLSNGDVLSRAGTAMVTTVAAHFHIPVVAFGETYKFTQAVWIGSLTNNELYQSADDVRSYMYDLTPVRMLDVIMTEYGPLPPCNVCTLIRDKSDVN
ncbi:eIF2B GDP-GTP exchange factor [Perkinsela sp. CCAP 1560/4]|nr:eIF2B GDP-GTP exchange factor [Perkinsela sp. CCAP 1560/4]|eukprot:KNH05459.1 eIF2B GDP-GTP exchange factor [Perkinsela sp. CCAP 1560/4]